MFSISYGPSTFDILCNLINNEHHNLSTNKENTYPRFIKLRLITDYISLSLKKNIEQCCVSSHEALLNTDGEKGFNTLNEEIQVKNEKISYEEKNHGLL